MERGLVFNIQRYCLHDGPGIRTTVFLKGCPLSCSWCHNPESQPREPAIRVIESRCVRCGHCHEACPQEQAGKRVDSSSHVPNDQRPVIPADCTLCGACVEACPTGARQMVGRDMTVEDVVNEVLRDRMFHDQSGGGATLSGGEPLAQAPFVLRLLQALRARSIHTALDTSGFAPRQVILDVAPWVDLFLYDVKCVDDQAHRLQTGVSNALILENLKTLGAIHANIWVRIPLVSGFNLDDAQLDASARYVASIPGVQQVNLLPYHRMGTGKSQRHGDPTAGEPLGLSAADDISPEQIDRAANLFRAAGLRTLVGG